LGFAVLTGIAEVRNDGGDTTGRCTTAGVNHNQQLHQVVVYRLTGGIDQEDICTAYSFLQGDRNLSVGESAYDTVSHRKLQFLADGLCKAATGCTAENFDV